MMKTYCWEEDQMDLTPPDRVVAEQYPKDVKMTKSLRYIQTRSCQYPHSCRDNVLYVQNNLRPEFRAHLRSGFHL